MNKAIIYGNLTRDPELKQLPSGGSVATFGVATNRRVKKEEQWTDVPEFHNVVVFGKQAENCAEYLRKGSAVLIDGRIQTRSWDKDGAKQYRTEVVAKHVQFGPRTQKTEAKHDDTIEYPEEDVNPDDVAF